MKVVRYIIPLTLMRNAQQLGHVVRYVQSLPNTWAQVEACQSTAILTLCETNEDIYTEAYIERKLLCDSKEVVK